MSDGQGFPTDTRVGHNGPDPTCRASSRMGGRLMGRVGLRLVATLAALMCLVGLAAPAMAAAKSHADTGYHIDLYRTGVFATQYRWTWCVGASSQAMLNIIQGTSDKSLEPARRSSSSTRWRTTASRIQQQGRFGRGRFGRGAQPLRRWLIQPWFFRRTYTQAVHRAAKAIARDGQACGSARHGRPSRVGHVRL